MKGITFLVLTSLAVCTPSVLEEIVSGEYMRNVNIELGRRNNLVQEAAWAYESNITSENQRESNAVSAEYAIFSKSVVDDVEMFNWGSYESDDLRRQFSKLTDLGYKAMPDNDYAALLNIISEMKANYAKVRVCDYNNRENCNLSLEPEIESSIQQSRDPKELEYYWLEFYNRAGTPMRQNFEKYINYVNTAAKINNYTSAAEMWLAQYEEDTFEQQLDAIFDSINPLYLQLHGYVRYRLNKFYGDAIVNKTAPIPMHLLGNMWAQKWRNIGDIVAPFPDKNAIDVTEEMINQGYTSKKMFQMGENFFTSLGLKELPKEFWNKSILEKPTDGRDMVCHASAWDFSKKNDVRIKMCTRVTQDQFFTVHHELGHIQYYLQYQDQPFIYRTGANPGFHEAVGDVLSLSVSTPRHLEAIGLLKNYVQDEETRLNQLFLTALDKIAFIPFAFTMDKYRWSLFRGEVDKKDWNCAFWNLREKYSGIEPPVVRTENDFDPPAKYHISADVEYLRYAVSFIIQFQLYKTVCIKAHQYDQTKKELPLDNCDIYGSEAAGAALHNMLSLGASKPWPDALEAFSGERTMTGDAIAEYFEPLRVWLEAENKKFNVPIGWTKSDKCIRDSDFYMYV